MHCVIDAARSRRLNDPLYRATAAAVAILGGLDHVGSFVFGGALFGCFGPGAQHDVWKSGVTDFVGMGYLYEQPRQHDQARSSHVGFQWSRYLARPIRAGQRTLLTQRITDPTIGIAAGYGKQRSRLLVQPSIVKQ